MSPLTLKKSRASKGSVSKVSLDRRRQERMCSGDALATPHFAQTGKTLLPWLKEQLLRSFDRRVLLNVTFEEYETVLEEVVDNEIVSLAKTKGKYSNDIDELVEEHNQELSTEELMELHCASQQEVMEESLTEKEEVTAKQ
ncbi:hypothetical protein AVEN_165327-1 [Araneus ventricosus]|uniref:Uncharacterized protein n=1 Tax=Araneus ventricosus TaxID=182803 RepID=A0A4Y2ATQ5_ARAVE|nr:hypothetical protein AVEN_165327-1 [Araneus ventricosus]